MGFSGGGGGAAARKLVTIRSGQAGALVLPAAPPAVDIPSANQSRVWADLTGMTQARVQVSLVSGGAAAPTLVVQYSTDNGATWNDIASVAFAANGAVVSAWGALPVPARGETLLRIAGTGDGVTSVSVSQVYLECK